MSPGEEGASSPVPWALPTPEACPCPPTPCRAAHRGTEAGGPRDAVCRSARPAGSSEVLLPPDPVLAAATAEGDSVFCAQLQCFHFPTLRHHDLHSWRAESCQDKSSFLCKRSERGPPPGSQPTRPAPGGSQGPLSTPDCLGTSDLEAPGAWAVVSPVTTRSFPG